MNLAYLKDIEAMRKALFPHTYCDKRYVPISQSDRCAFCNKPLSPENKGVVCPECVRGFEDDDTSTDRRVTSRG